MAKGLRSKVKRRFRTAKRLLIRNTLELSRNTEKSNALREIGNGTYVQKEPTLNAFLFPESPNAVFPQKNRDASVDFRSDSMSGIAGYMGPGNRRKYYPGEKVPVLSIMGSGNLTNSRDVEIVQTSLANSSESMMIGSLDSKLDTNTNGSGVSRKVTVPVIKDSIKGAYEASFKRKGYKR